MAKVFQSTAQAKESTLQNYVKTCQLHYYDFSMGACTVQHHKACHLFSANVIMKNYMEKDCHQDVKVKTAL